MKKFIIGALAAVMATLSLAAVAEADTRNRGDEWRHHSRSHNDNGRNWRGDRGREHFRADRGRSWRHDGWRRDGWRHGWRYGGWRHGYWGGPRVVIAPVYNDYCFIKKVRHLDRYGNPYIKRVRVCR